MADKSEAPTPNRLQDARQEGQVARSVDLNSASGLLMGLLLVGIAGRDLIFQISMIISQTAANLSGQDLSEGMVGRIFANDLLAIIPSLAIILAGLLVTGVTVSFAQTGLLWASKKLGLHLERLNPIPGFKRIFSSNGLFELGKALLKLVVVGYVAYTYLQSNATQLINLFDTDLNSSTTQWISLASALAVRVAIVYFVLAAMDYIYQRWKLMQKLRMTKEEVKEEMKRSEGDPIIKGYIRNQQRRMARSRMMAAVPKASVVITNPTHFACAIQYNPNMHAPKLLAKGAYLTAQRIVTIARANDIPVVQNIPLARAIYRLVEIDHEIPQELYTTMAEVLAYVYRLHGKMNMTSAA
jgi:flagellar biosynthesis protein FlhB